MLRFSFKGSFEGDIYIYRYFGLDLGALGISYGPFLWAPILKVVSTAVIVGLEGFRIRGHTKGTIGSTLEGT